jgi:hypothetical protein
LGDDATTTSPPAAIGGAPPELWWRAWAEGLIALALFGFLPLVFFCLDW